MVNNDEEWEIHTGTLPLGTVQFLVHFNANKRTEKETHAAINNTLPAGTVFVVWDGYDVVAWSFAGRMLDDMRNQEFACWLLFGILLFVYAAASLSEIRASW